jgi:hypothetical protein
MKGIYCLINWRGCLGIKLNKLLQKGAITGQKYETFLKSKIE